jgi:hypothetical protein
MSSPAGNPEYGFPGWAVLLQLKVVRVIIKGKEEFSGTISKVSQS